MPDKSIKRNERDWAGQLISWLKSAIEKGITVFQDATNDTSIKMESGKTKFPDILLFTDKVSGIIFNGWELKFPDTAVDDLTLLNNALEKAKKIQSDSFVTWNGTQAVIWKIDTSKYTINSLTKIKEYPTEPTISIREDLSEPGNFLKHEALLKQRAYDILYDLGKLYTEGNLKPAINITGNILNAIQEAAGIIIPQFQVCIENEKNTNYCFRYEFLKWKIHESSTLKILSSSSRRVEHIIPEQILAKFTFYSLIGKILFYLTLCENLSGELHNLKIENTNDLKFVLDSYFEQAKTIDYQAIFQPSFTDCITYTHTVEKTLYNLLAILTEFDFRILPSTVIGNILENLVPKNEKQKFGQYFTPEILANLTAFPVVKTNSDFLFDPTCGSGTFLNSFYKILNFYGVKNHSVLLNQIWGNDISHFPALLSIINLYKQDVTQTDNFPRVMRNDFFNLEVGQEVVFPDSQNYKKHIPVKMPLFDGIASNFPFIQQEDIPNDVLTAYFQKYLIDERSDYFTYCIYNSIRFLKKGGMLSAITSNAWLGKEYGFQFKKILLNNFHIQYIVQSNAEHWFADSQVSTIFFILENSLSSASTRFVTINFKLDEYFNQDTIRAQLGKIEDFYTEINTCDDPKNKKWKQDTFFSDLYINQTDNISVCMVSQNTLINSIHKKENWSQYFISSNLFLAFDKYLIQFYPNIFDVIRGERTGWNDMFIIKQKDRDSIGIEEKYLVPMIKSPTELSSILFKDSFSHYFFVCKDQIENVGAGAQNWINAFENKSNQNGKKTVSEATSGHKPYWYTIQPKQANIITAINPYQRFFFTYSKKSFAIDQRLIAMKVKEKYDIELITALLNSAITYLTLEMRGTSRNLGALDLNANYLKTLKVLNPDLLNNTQKENIIKAFKSIEDRAIGTIFEELKREDRIHFDTVILESFGISTNILTSIYSLLTTSVSNRVKMKEK